MFKKALGARVARRRSNLSRAKHGVVTQESTFVETTTPAFNPLMYCNDLAWRRVRMCTLTNWHRRDKALIC